VKWVTSSMFAGDRSLWLAQMVGTSFIPPFVFQIDVLDLNESFVTRDSIMTFRKQKSPLSLMLGPLRQTNPALFSASICNINVVSSLRG
jgi:hypothetical protein